MRHIATLGQKPRRFPWGKVLLLALMGGAGGGVYWMGQHGDFTFHPRFGDEATAPRLVAGRAPTGAQEPQPVAPVIETPRAPTQSELLRKAGLDSVSVEIRGPLETALVDQLGRETGAALAQVVTRTLVWWIDVPQDLLRGDRLEVLFETRPNEEPLVHAVRFQSGKTGKLHRVYRFQAPGDAYARYYTPDFAELEQRLLDSPIDDYEQITSLLRDGRRHKGVDFKAAVGTPVKAPFAGVITRRNWNWRGNGNCLELTDTSGAKKALFLHLDVLPPGIKVGDRIARGQALASSGNSGRSFAPHLHYQLMRGEDRVLDPFDVHGTFRRNLPETARVPFEAEIARLDGLLAPGAAVASGTR